MKSKRVKCLVLTTTLCVSLATVGAFLAGHGRSNSIFTKAFDDPNSLIISPSNPVTDGYVRTVKGSPIYLRDDGVTWNDYNLAFQVGGYIQNLTIIHGIESVSVELSSGSLDLYHGYVEPENLETPFYGADYTFTSNYTYHFGSELPNRVRLIANENSVVSKITITFDCESANSDLNAETLDDGLENSYIDAGPVNSYARTSYSLDTASDSSLRSLKATFKGTNAETILLSTEKNRLRELASTLPDFSDVMLSFKAKLSNDITYPNISVQAVGESWTTSNYFVCDRTNIDANGWYTYTADFSHISFENNDRIIRIYLRPDGIDSNNKDSAFILFDEITYSRTRYSQGIKLETIYDGLENMVRDVGMENVYASFDNENTYGRVSKSSLLARPKDSMGSADHYNIVLSPEGQINFNDCLVGDLSTGSLVFEYKPVNIKNPSTIYIHALETWSNSVRKTVSTTELKNGWYQFNFDLSQLNFSNQLMIRLKIGFDVESSNLSKAKIYFDNIRVLESNREDYTQGLENLYPDSGMSGYTNYSVDYANTSSGSSLNSLKCTLSKSTYGWRDNQGVIYVVDDSELTQMRCNSGILEAKFLFTNAFTSKEVWLNLVDANWTGARFKGIIPEAIGNGWYQISVDLSTLQSWPGEKMETGTFDYSTHPIRVGFSFAGVPSATSSDIAVWVDDVFYYPDTVVVSTAPIIWQAYDTENVRRDDDVIANRSITSASPLKFADARNGIDSSQLMLKARSNVSSYNFRPSSLRGNNGDILPASCFEVLVAKYFYVNAGDSNINGESGKTGHMGSGYYPDALVPIDRIIKANENTITNGQQQSIWINCEIPKDQRAGTYTGYGILTVDGVDYSIPMKVTVYDVTLSGINHNKTCFLIWYDKVQIAEPVYNESMREIYFDYLLDKGISGASNYEWSKWTIGDMDAYDSFADNFANYIMPNDKISTYRIPMESTQESITGYLNALVNRNKLEWDKGNHVNFFDKAIIVLCDEPSNPSITNTEPQAWKNCKTVQTYIKNAISSLSSSLSDYPVIRAGLNDVRNVVTIGCDYNRITGSGLYKNLLTTDYIGVPCPQFSKVDNASERETYLSRFNHAWFYGCSNPQLPYPSYHMDTPLLGQRLITWMQYDYGFEGTLYFCTNMYSVSDRSDELRDVWTEPMIGQFAGDGQLTYPGGRYNIFGPITSMRLENIRNSMEDYEYFYLMDERLAVYNANTGSNISSCKDLLASEFSQMFSGTQLKSRGHTSNTGYKAQDFDEFRTYLLERLEYCE